MSRWVKSWSDTLSREGSPTSQSMRTMRGGRIVVSSAAPTAAEADLLMKRGSATAATACPRALTLPPFDSETISSHGDVILG